jgi:DUF917 family protein
LARRIGIQEIEDIAVGAAILGTGGGGDPYIGKLMAIDAIEEFGPITMLDPSELADDSLVVPTAMMGAPTVLVEKVPRGDEVFSALAALEAKIGKRTAATMSIEAGGINSTIPLTVSARLGIPIVDCDGIGRAFPEVQMCIPGVLGIKATPMTMSDEKGNFVVLETADNLWTERIARSITVTMGGTALVALYSMTGKEVKEKTVHHTMSLAEKIGITIREARASKRNPIEALLRLVGGFEIFRGKIVDVLRRTEGGFARGEARIEGIDDYSEEELVIQFQNENLVAMRNKEIVATVPDLITTLEAETGLPITTEGLRYGYRVIVIGIPCDRRWRTEQGLKVGGPRYFRYDVEYVALEVRLNRMR